MFEITTEVPRGSGAVTCEDGSSCHTAPAPRNESKTQRELVSGSLCYNTNAINVAERGRRLRAAVDVLFPPPAQKNGLSARHDSHAQPAFLDDHIALPARGERHVSST